MSEPDAKYPTPEVVLFLLWVGSTISIVITLRHHPAVALGCCVFAALLASMFSRQIRQVRRISQNKRRYGD